MIRKIQNANIENKKVLLRVGFNVEVEKGEIKEKFKIESAKDTLNYLLKRKAQVALVSHLGRPGGKIEPKFSLAPLVNKIEEILKCKIKFIPNCIGKEVLENVANLKKGTVILLENVRFYKGERENNIAFAKKLATGFDIFVNDAFSVSHRDQASVTGVTKFLPSYAGLRLQKEIEEMKKIKQNSLFPSVAIVGGAKIATKLPMIKFFESRYDYILVGGKIANEILDQKLEFSQKVILPVDFAQSHLDIGNKTIAKFEKIILKAKMIIWNGPLGKFEEKKYAVGSEAILKAIIKSGAYSVIGGGETIEILQRNKSMDKVSFISTGGGAMLAYLSGEKMPGIEVLEE